MKQTLKRFDDALHGHMVSLKGNSKLMQLMPGILTLCMNACRQAEIKRKRKEAAIAKREAKAATKAARAI